MRDSRLWETPVAFAGVLYLVLFLVGGVGPVTPGPQAPAAEIAQVLMNSTDATRRGIYINLIGVFCNLVFVSYLAARIRQAVGDRLAWLGGLVLAGGVTSVTVFLVLEALWMAGSGGVDFTRYPEIAKMLDTLAWEFGGLLGPSTAALVGGAASGIIASGLLPRWFGWIGVVLAVVAVLSGFTGGFLSLLGSVWLAVVSSLLALKVTLRRPAGAPAT